ncbi:transketolase [Asanoa sp. NPDC049518]|uniref:transketolase n=1 Tax=unclassified Asanoa TaxID=2685164 RepID=UPI0034386FC3
MATTALDERSLYLRRLVVRALAGGGRGHVGPSFSLIEILRVLYDDFLNVRPKDPGWPDRDRLILSKGHGCLALYALLADKGFFPAAALDAFCREGAMLGGHPERGPVPGVEASTGALGHGLPIGVGLALALRRRGLPGRVVVVTGDGELNEGSNWEAALMAAKHELGELSVFVDANGFQCYGETSQVLNLEPMVAKWEAFGFDTHEVDGHDVKALRSACAVLPSAEDRPSAVICRTIKGKGVPFVEGNPRWHYRFQFEPLELEAILHALTPNALATTDA